MSADSAAFSALGEYVTEINFLALALCIVSCCAFCGWCLFCSFCCALYRSSTRQHPRLVSPQQLASAGAGRRETRPLLNGGR